LQPVLQDVLRLGPIRCCEYQIPFFSRSICLIASYVKELLPASSRLDEGVEVGGEEAHAARSHVDKDDLAGAGQGAEAGFAHGEYVGGLGEGQ
jgi:hypothetical protein